MKTSSKSKLPLISLVSAFALAASCTVDTSGLTFDDDEFARERVTATPETVTATPETVTVIGAAMATWGAVARAMATGTIPAARRAMATAMEAAAWVVVQAAAIRAAR
jgi:hypothetical protein